MVADSTTGLLGFAILMRDSEGRGQLFRTAGRIFGGLSDTAKAFIIIASTDILLGCDAARARSRDFLPTVMPCTTSQRPDTLTQLWDGVLVNVGIRERLQPQYHGLLPLLISR